MPRNRTAAASPPLVTVIMPVRNEALWIARSVGAVLGQTYPRDRLDILLVDGQSEDETVSIVLALPEANRLRILENSQQIQAAGMNRGLEAARGKIIVRVDGHTVIAPDYVWRCVELLRTTGADSVGGSISPVGTTDLGHAIAAAARSPFAIPAKFRVSRKAQDVDTVYMGAWRRSLFEQIGFFDEQFVVNEDYEFNYRIRKAGGRLYFSPDLCSEYYGQPTLRALARQYFRYGFWKPLTLRKHPASLQVRHLTAPLFVAFVGGGALLTRAFPALTALWQLGLLVYGVLNLVFSLRSGRGRTLPLLARLPLVFTTIHIAWGIGFWVGAARLLIRSLSESA